MATIVSTRITRLQAISPRVSAVNIPSSLVPVAISSVPGVGAMPDTTKIALYWNSTTNQFEIWKDAEFKITPAGTLQYTISVPSLSLSGLVPSAAVSTGTVSQTPVTASPPSLSLFLPTQTIAATSP